MLHALTNDELFRKVPSAFATRPWAEVSDSYTFIPTVSIIDTLRTEGFIPVRAEQSKTRIPGKSEFTKHIIRFQRAQDLELMVDAQRRNPGHYFYERNGQVAPEVTEIVLTNSHDRTGGFHLDAGLFRLACSNGLIVKTASLDSINVRHTGNIRDNVIDGCIRIIEDTPKILGQVELMKGIKLDQQEQTVFANAAMQLRYPADDKGNSTSPILTASLLRPRRNADTGTDVFTTMNVVQENFMKGGLRGRGTTGKRTSTRAINSVNEDLRLNKALWMLAEQMAALKS